MGNKSYMCEACEKPIMDDTIAHLPGSVCLCPHCHTEYNKFFKLNEKKELEKIHKKLRKNIAKLAKIDTYYAKIESTLTQLIQTQGAAKVTVYIKERASFADFPDLMDITKEDIIDFAEGREEWSREKLLRIAAAMIATEVVYINL